MSASALLNNGGVEGVEGVGRDGWGVSGVRGEKRCSGEKDLGEEDEEEGVQM